MTIDDDDDGCHGFRHSSTTLRDCAEGPLAAWGWPPPDLLPQPHTAHALPLPQPVPRGWCHPGRVAHIVQVLQTYKWSDEDVRGVNMDVCSFVRHVRVLCCVKLLLNKQVLLFSLLSTTINTPMFTGMSSSVVGHSGRPQHPPPRYAAPRVAQ